MVRDTRASANAVAAAAENGAGGYSNGTNGHGLAEGSVNGSVDGSVNETRSGNGARRGLEVPPTSPPGVTTPAANGKKRKRGDHLPPPPTSLSPPRHTRSSMTSPAQSLAVDESAQDIRDDEGEIEKDLAPGPAVKRIKLRTGSNASSAALGTNGMPKIKLKLPSQKAKEQMEEHDGGIAEAEIEEPVKDGAETETEKAEKPGKPKLVIPKRVNGKFAPATSRQKSKRDTPADVAASTSGPDSAVIEAEEETGLADSAVPMEGVEAVVEAEKPSVAAAQDKIPDTESQLNLNERTAVEPESLPEGESEGRYSTRRSGRHPRAAAPAPSAASTRSKKKLNPTPAAPSEAEMSLDEEAWTEGPDELEPMPEKMKKDLVVVLDKVLVPPRSKSLLDQAALFGGSMTLRDRLNKAIADISLGRVENLLHRLAAETYPACRNPFLASPTEQSVRLISRNRKNKTKVAAEEEYLIALKRVIDSFSRTSTLSGQNVASGPTPLPTVRWHLHQRLPAAVPNARPPKNMDPARWVPPPPIMQEWYSSSAVVVDLPKTEQEKIDDEDARLAKSQEVKEEGKDAEQEEEATGVMEQLFQRSAFGNAMPVIPADVAFEEEAAPPLGEVLLMRASLKAKMWKEKRQASSGEMGFTGRPVEYLHCSNTFTPSFAPTHDSSRATGGWGYYTTAELARYRTNNKSWLKAGWNNQFGADWSPLGQRVEDEPRDEGDSEEAAVEAESSAQAVARELLGDGPDSEQLSLAVQRQREYTDHVQSLLDQNARWVQQLAYWRDIRTRRGAGPVPGEEEAQTADKLMKSLQELAAIASPAQLIGTKRASTSSGSASSAGLATFWAKQAIPGSTPNYRGTLDPARRTRALADNLTFSDKSTVQSTGVQEYQQGRIGHLPLMPGALPTPAPQSTVPWQASPGRLDALAGSHKPTTTPSSTAFPTPPPVTPISYKGTGAPYAPHGNSHSQSTALPFPDGKIPNPSYGAVPLRPMYPPANPYSDLPYSPFVNVGRTTKELNGSPRGPPNLPPQRHVLGSAAAGSGRMTMPGVRGDGQRA